LAKGDWIRYYIIITQQQPLNAGKLAGLYWWNGHAVLFGGKKYCDFSGKGNGAHAHQLKTQKKAKKFAIQVVVCRKVRLAFTAAGN